MIEDRYHSPKSVIPESPMNLVHHPASYYRGAPHYRVRIFDPRGQYPHFTFATQDALYSASESLVFTVVRSQRWDWRDERFPYSEMDWATPQELHFWGSILLCEHRNAPNVILYPSSDAIFELDSPACDLRKPTIQKRISDLLNELSKTRRRGRNRQLRALKYYFDQPYSCFKHDYFYKRQPEFFRSVGPDDHLFLRGIACLIRSDMLSRHSDFGEEVAMVLFVAMDALFSLTIRLLKSQGITNPSSKDVDRWYQRTFNEPLGLYISEDSEDVLYKQRIMTFHPASRFGTALYAPLMHGDYMQMRHDFRELFAYLATEKHGSDFKAAVREARKWDPIYR